MKKLSGKSLLYFLPSLIWMIIIFALSSRQSISVAEKPLLNFIFFKSLHVIEYCVLYILNVFALRKNLSKHAFLYSAYLTIIYALSDEIHQMSVPSREGIFRDILIDGLGVFVGYKIIKLFKK